MIISSIDFETTGMPAAKPDTTSHADDGKGVNFQRDMHDELAEHAIVEIGTCELTVRDDGVSTFVDYPRATFCNPGRPIDHGAMAAHHITDAMVAGAEGNLSFVPSEVDYYVAHNADFEMQFWTPGRPMICTYKVALRLWPDAEAHNLQFLRYHLGLEANEIQANPPHRAGPDSYVCALLMERIIKEQRASIDDMVRWSGGLALFHRISFGKHKGMLWQDLPGDYLNWIIDKSDMDRGVKANALYRLKQRAKAQDSSIAEQQKERLL